jgi:hypothetical protein
MTHNITPMSDVEWYCRLEWYSAAWHFFRMEGHKAIQDEFWSGYRLDHKPYYT